jgi:hypothetical protein
MRSLTALKTLLGVAALATFMLGASKALADDKETCNAAYDQTQTLRRDGKLQAALVEALVCMRDVCAEFVRADCAKWLGELEAVQPTVVFQVQDTHGRGTTAVRVSLDGQPWLSELDGKSRPIDPGQHTIRFEIDGSSPIDQQVDIVEGDKAKKIAFSFAPAPARPTDEVVSAKPAPAAKGGVPGWAWGIGATGVAAVGVGIGFGAAAAGEASAWHRICPAANCVGLSTEQKAQVNSESGRAQTFGILAGVIGGLGVAAMGVGIYGIASAPRAATESQARVVFSTTGVQLKGTF